MARIIFPNGLSKKELFGSGRGQIHVTKLADGRVTVKRHKTSYTVSEEFFMKRLEISPGYTDVGAYFKGFYWGTEQGMKEKDNIYQTNFNRAVRMKYGDASNKMQEYTRYMFSRLGRSGREKFTDLYPEDIEEIFQYEEESIKEWMEGGHTRYIQQGNQDINRIINDLESMFSPEEVEQMRKKFNYRYYQRRYGMT